MRPFPSSLNLSSRNSEGASSSTADVFFGWSSLISAVNYISQSCRPLSETLAIMRVFQYTFNIHWSSENPLSASTFCSREVLGKSASLFETLIHCRHRQEPPLSLPKSYFFASFRASSTFCFQVKSRYYRIRALHSSSGSCLSPSFAIVSDFGPGKLYTDFCTRILQTFILR